MLQSTSNGRDGMSQAQGWSGTRIETKLKLKLPVWLKGNIVLQHFGRIYTSYTMFCTRAEPVLFLFLLSICLSWQDLFRDVLAFWFRTFDAHSDILEVVPVAENLGISKAKILCCPLFSTSSFVGLHSEPWSWILDTSGNWSRWIAQCECYCFQIGNRFIEFTLFVGDSVMPYEFNL